MGESDAHAAASTHSWGSSVSQPERADARHEKSQLCLSPHIKPGIISHRTRTTWNACMRAGLGVVVVVVCDGWKGQIPFQKSLLLFAPPPHIRCLSPPTSFSPFSLPHSFSIPLEQGRR